MRLSLLGSTGWLGSTNSSRLPLPLVSSTNGVQPCDFISSPVSSSILVLTQPSTWAPTPPELDHSVRLASKPNCTWWVGKQVLIVVNFWVAGSSMMTWRFDAAIGNTFADGWSDPALQASGLACGRM